MPFVKNLPITSKRFSLKNFQRLETIDERKKNKKKKASIESFRPGTYRATEHLVRSRYSTSPAYGQNLATSTYVTCIDALTKTYPRSRGSGFSERKKREAFDRLSAVFVRRESRALRAKDSKKITIRRSRERDERDERDEQNALEE